MHHGRPAIISAGPAPDRVVATIRRFDPAMIRHIPHERNGRPTADVRIRPAMTSQTIPV